MRYAVSFVNFSSYELTTEIVTADSWQDALLCAFPGQAKHVLPSDDMLDAQDSAIDQDWTFDVVEIQ